jgi:hypothetical protein
MPGALVESGEEYEVKFNPALCCAAAAALAGSRGFMRIHPPHQQLEQHMQQVGAQRSAEVEDRDDDRLVRTWLAAKCKQDFRWC